MFLGEVHGFGLEIPPEFARQRDIIAACGQTFNEQRFQPRKDSGSDMVTVVMVSFLVASLSTLSALRTDLN